MPAYLPARPAPHQHEKQDEPAHARPAAAHIAFLAVFIIVFAFAAVDPWYPRDFWLENALVIPFVALLVWDYARCRFSTAAYAMILLFLVIHEWGAHSTYSETPAGEWLARQFSWSRNHYDRIVHGLFGLLMATPLRELLRRWAVPPTPAILLVPPLLLALGAAYEILESWSARIVDPNLGVAFLGAQGDSWDAQRDLAIGLAGSMAWLVLLLAVRTTGWSRPASPGSKPARGLPLANQSENQ